MTGNLRIAFYYCLSQLMHVFPGEIMSHRFFMIRLVSFRYQLKQPIVQSVKVCACFIDPGKRHYNCRNINGALLKPHKSWSTHAHQIFHDANCTVLQIYIRARTIICCDTYGYYYVFIFA